MCEDCLAKRPSYGLPSEGTGRWCASCGKTHRGAQRLRELHKCEDCNEKVPSYGLPMDDNGQPLKAQRWCAQCAKSHPGARNLSHKMKCQDCREKAPSFGLAHEGKKRWCGPCAKLNHPGTINLNKRKACEDCGKKTPNYGLKTEWKRRWCMGCVKTTPHPGAELLLRCAPKRKTPKRNASKRATKRMPNSIDNTALQNNNVQPDSSMGVLQGLARNLSEHDVAQLQLGLHHINSSSVGSVQKRWGRKHRQRLKCKRCGQAGHNTRTCRAIHPLVHDALQNMADGSSQPQPAGSSVASTCAYSECSCTAVLCGAESRSYRSAKQKPPVSSPFSTQMYPSLRPFVV
jgi:hypothetical protein